LRQVRGGMGALAGEGLPFSQPQQYRTYVELASRLANKFVDCNKHGREFRLYFAYVSSLVEYYCESIED